MAIEGVKIKPQYQAFLDEHFSISPKWDDFHKKLKNKSFVTAVQQDTRSNDKLKAFVDAVSMREQAKGPAVKALSDVSGSYKVRYHPEHDRFSCTCPDWTFKRSVSGADCKHIDRIKTTSKDSLMEKTKEASAAEVLFRIGRTVNHEKKDNATAANLKAENEMLNQAFPRQSFVQAFLKKGSEIAKQTVEANKMHPLLKEAYRRKFAQDSEMAKKMGQAARRMLTP